MKEQNIHTELLNTIYQISEAAYQIIDNLEEKMKEEKFKNIVRKHRGEYKKISDDSIRVFIKYGKDEKEVSPLAKATGNIIVTLKTIKDDTANLAKILMEKGNKGLLNISEKLNNYTKEDSEIVDLAKKLIKTIEENIADLKDYL